MCTDYYNMDDVLFILNLLIRINLKYLLQKIHPNNKVLISLLGLYCYYSIHLPVYSADIKNELNNQLITLVHKLEEIHC